MQVLMTFSACTNLEKLNKPDSTDDMGILHGLRLFSMVFIILGHRCLFTYGGPFFNPEFLEEVNLITAQPHLKIAVYKMQLF